MDLPTGQWQTLPDGSWELLRRPVPQVRNVSLTVNEGGGGTPVEGADVAYDVEVDTATPGVTYVGEADPGTASATAAWRIKRITETATTASVDWADGNSGFVHQWTQRLTYTYGP
jgi:hypothetical protein